MAGELITRDQQIQWATKLWGDGTDVQIGQVSGWDTLPGLDSGTVARAQQHGAYAGRLLAQSRIITADGVITAADLPTARRALLAATSLLQDEQPLVIRLAGESLLVNARVIARAIPNDGSFTAGTPTVTIAWEATDPRRYQLTEQTAVTGLPTSEAGLSWGSPSETGLAWGSPSETGLAWGSPGATGDALVTNSGDAEAHPVIEIRGPCTTPSITVRGTSRVLEYGLTLAASDTLTIDCWAGTVLLGGQDRLGTATARSVPEGLITIPPGTTTTLSFRSADLSPDPAASATVRWRSAYW